MTKLHEECGLFGIYNRNDFNPAMDAHHALYALQHRGQESCGIAVNDDGTIISHKDTGLVPDVFNQTVLAHLSGFMALGHVRYSMASLGKREDAQPLVTKYKKGALAVAYNGSLRDADQERQLLESEGAIFQTDSYAEIITYLLARERLRTHSIEDAVVRILERLRGGYSLLVMSPRKLIAARDPHGLRPLVIGKKQDSYCFASETCALDAIGAEFERNVQPGEVAVLDQNGLRNITKLCTNPSSICIFEYIYFARNDSYIEGVSVYEARKAAGARLAIEHPTDADLVIGVPDSGLAAAIGYAAQSGIPYGEGLVKNRYIGRTFILPTQAERAASVNIKLNPLKASIEGKRIVLVEDSIVRGTTSAHIIHQLKAVGAKEVHMRVSSPPFKHPCYYGTDVPCEQDLIYNKYSLEEIRKMIGADSLGFLSIDGLKTIVPSTFPAYCEGCFTGQYPV